MKKTGRIRIEDLPMIQELYDNRFSGDVVVVVIVARLVVMLTTRWNSHEIPHFL
jgi:hypothetical protein